MSLTATGINLSDLIALRPGGIYAEKLKAHAQKKDEQDACRQFSRRDMISRI